MTSWSPKGYKGVALGPHPAWKQTSQAVRHAALDNAPLSKELTKAGKPDPTCSRLLLKSLSYIPTMIITISVEAVLFTTSLYCCIIVS